VPGRCRGSRQSGTARSKLGPVGGRRAAGAKINDFEAERKRQRPVESRANVLHPEEIHRALRVGPLSGGDGAAAIVITTAGIANNKLGGIPVGWSVAALLMRSFTDAACVRRGGRHRQRERNNVSREREEQQQSGGQALHTSFESGTPRCEQHRTEARPGQGSVRVQRIRGRRIFLRRNTDAWALHALP